MSPGADGRPEAGGAGAGRPLEVATPERVLLSLPIVGFGHRGLAYLIDVGILCAFWICLAFLLTFLSRLFPVDWSSLSGWVRVALAIGVFATQWLYWTLSELAMQGQSLGKRAMKIRVVRDDGGPVGFSECALRNLLRAVDFLPLAYGLGCVCILVSERHQRLGDMVAGTVLTAERPVSLARYEAAEVQTALPVFTTGAGPALSTVETELVLDLLERLPTLPRPAQERLLGAFLLRFGAHLSVAEREGLAQSPAVAEAFLRSRARGLS